ncbi:DUF4238 domain-containing protein [Caulobacter sp. 602-1]|uniref:DUF4238 domain-containing protein n=1 Tax=unclassified Caulobacter TaxID=2648921 RepID=UPI000F63764E|nr:DUF4238 domain-containing protein [Caulobacter sp. 602-1]RRN64981.1 DUF4238 domain-containing protein [Caulobacter sp. 602-1]
MRNHFVPQFLQRPWTDSSGELQVFRMKSGRFETYRQVPKGNGYLEDMLSLTRDKVAGMDKHAIEKVVLQSVDNDASKVRDKLEAGQLGVLTIEERSAWVRFIMSLQLRQPSTVLYLRSESEALLRKSLAEQPDEYDAIAMPGAPATLEEWTEKHFPGAIENFGLSFFHELLNDQGIGNKLLRLRWWVWDFSVCRHHLLLADCPCTFAGGIDNPNLAVILPISPTKAFMATRGELTADALRKADPKLLLGRLNDASTKQATERVFARDASPRRFIENRWPAATA